jgi:hypothetical protein
LVHPALLFTMRVCTDFREHTVGWGKRKKDICLPPIPAALEVVVLLRSII